MHVVHAMPFGAEVLAGGGVRFRLWAPGASRVELELDDRRHAMAAVADGWYELWQADASAGSRYRYVIDDDLRVPDPASRFNPEDIHGASEVIDPTAYAWREQDWCGRPWEEAVIYELHVGSFTPEGTYAAAQARLPELAALGITVIELMPVADFPGRGGWGYDGVLPFAPDAAYGTPLELKRFIDEAHGLGLMVLLDAVYNHFGPEGNYLHAWCPQFFNPRHQTPWGAAINFDGEHCRTVRDFFVHNALYWIEEYRFDGLRLDAIHAIRDDSAPHIVQEIADALHNGPGGERHLHLVLENDANEAHFLQRGRSLQPLGASAQWNDDIHHAVHVLTTGETDGYYADFADAPLAHFGRALAEGFAFQGEASPYRGGAPRGEPSAGLPSTAFVSFLQTHDQVGNRALGDRIHTLADPVLLRAAYACVLLSPHIPMLFMGEEFAASTPFLYFCDFGPELADAVARGRREEFRGFAAFADPAARARIPDPNDPQTRAASVLRWEERQRSPHREQLALVKELLSLRAKHLVPRLAGMLFGGEYRVENDLLRVNWILGDGTRWHLLANFSSAAAEATPPPGLPIYTLAPTVARAPGAVMITLEPAGA